MEDIHSECLCECIFLTEIIGCIQLNTMLGHQQNTIGELDRQIQFVRRDEDGFSLFVCQATEQLQNLNAIG